MAKFQVTPKLFKGKVADKGSRDGVLVAKNSGLRMVHWWGEVLAANEAKKASDAELMEMVQAEFPGRLKAGKQFQSAPMYRSYYNMGKHGTTPDGKPPRVKSVRHGDAIERTTLGGFTRAAKPAAKGKGKPSKAKPSKAKAGKPAAKADK